MNRISTQTLSLSLGIFLIFSLSLIVSLFFKDHWLWMDEVLSYLLVSDPSLAHANDALVSGMDANPPLFVNVYWILGHAISLDFQFLRMVSIVFFALTLALFFWYTTTLVGTPLSNFVLITLIAAFTYLNLTLATQVRSYALFLLISLPYFVVLHRLIAEPRHRLYLGLFVLLGLGLSLTHNFGLFYLAASGSFFFLLWLWSKRQSVYLWPMGAHVLTLLLWAAGWFTRFQIQTEAGKPHSWIPLPTWQSFFTTVGELSPTLSYSLEQRSWLAFLPYLRFFGVAFLFVFILRKKLRNGYAAFRTDAAFQFYLLSGFIYFSTILISLAVSLVHTSVFISRYLWPNHLLVMFQLMYAFYQFYTPPRLSGWYRLAPVYALIIGAFVFYQNRKVVHFPKGILSYLPQMDPRYPVFVETADYFLPIWFHKFPQQVHYLIHWPTAAVPTNILSATVEHKILKSVREKYQVPGLILAKDFTKANFPHFYVVDESSHYQMEKFINAQQIRVVRQLPIDIDGHRLLECTFN